MICGMTGTNMPTMPIKTSTVPAISERILSTMVESKLSQSNRAVSHAHYPEYTLYTAKACYNATEASRTDGMCFSFEHTYSLELRDKTVRDAYESSKRRSLSIREPVG